MPDGRRTTRIQEEPTREKLIDELSRVKRKFNRFRSYVVTNTVKEGDPERLRQLLRGPQFNPEKL